MKTTGELIPLIELEQLEDTIFRGSSIPVGSPNVFGGQVVSQALNAATRTVPEERICHSLHAYFILPGNLQLPIDFHVQHVRDGGSFTTRYVVAKQNDTPIFVMACSFQKPEEGYTHQIPMPVVPAPETLDDWMTIREKYASELSSITRKFIEVERPIEFRPCQPGSSTNYINDTHYQVWFKFREAPENLSWPLVQQLIAYASDYNILTTALRPHAKEALSERLQLASLDHAIWFHNETDLSDWLLFDITSPAAAGARGFASGNIFNREGKLIASVSQEGLMRKLK